MNTQQTVHDSNASSLRPLARQIVQVPTIRHFDVRFINSEGSELGKAVFSLEATLGESTSILPYQLRSNHLLIGLTDQRRAGIAARTLLSTVREGEKDDSLPGFEIRPGVPSTILPGPFIPSAGSSCELSHLYPVLLDEATAAADPSLHFVDAEQIVTDYLSGNPCDTRVVLAALRLASKCAIQLPVKLPIGRATYDSPPGALQRLSAEQMPRILYAKPDSLDSAYGVLCSEVGAPAKPFLSTVASPYENIPVTVRRGVDSVDVGAYVWRDKELCLVLKRGLRPSLTILQSVIGRTPEPTAALTFEGIAESLEGESTIEQIGQRAAQGIREEAGFEPAGEPLYVGSSFPSSHFHAERVFNFMIEVDPNRPIEAEHTLDERVDVWCVAVRDIIKLCEQGIIHDPRLEINARLLHLTAGLQ